MRVSVGEALFTGMGLGFASNLVVSQLDRGDDPSKATLGYLVAGPVLAGAGLIGAIRFEHTVGPFVDRFAVDGAEQITKRSVNLDWSTRSAKVGAFVTGCGVGIMSGTTGLLG